MRKATDVLCNDIVFSFNSGWCVFTFRDCNDLSPRTLLCCRIDWYFSVIRFPNSSQVRSDKGNWLSLNIKYPNLGIQRRYDILAEAVSWADNATIITNTCYSYKISLWDLGCIFNFFFEKCSLSSLNIGTYFSREMKTNEETVTCKRRKQKWRLFAAFSIDMRKQKQKKRKEKKNPSGF